MGPDREADEAAIRAARAHSNRSILRRNLLGVGDSLAENYVGVVGDGSFVASRAEYLRLFKDGFDAPKSALTYERVTDRVEVSATGPLAAEHGRWTAWLPDGRQGYRGSYLAMWRLDEGVWKIRSETFVTLEGFGN